MGLGRVMVVLAMAAAGLASAPACGDFGETSSPTADASPAGDSASGDSAPAPPGDGGGCVLGTAPSTLAAVVSAPSKLATNGEHVFWIEGNTRLVRASLRDCQRGEVATGNITALAVDAQWIVWGDPGYHVLARSDVGKAPQTNKTTVSPTLILAGSVAYWLDDRGVVSCSTPCSSTTVAVLVGAPKLLAADASKLFVFGLDPNAGTTVDLWSRALAPSAASGLTGPLATNQDPTLLAANSAGVFWVSSSGQVAGVPGGGGSPIPLPKVAGARALAADEQFVYVATSDTIGRAPVTGGALVPVVMGESEITSLVVTDDSLVWASSAGIRRVRK